MAASTAQINANRNNALKSSGPKTPEGKALARANAVKHGLTGAGVALPTEAASMVEQRFLTLQEEMGPSNLASRLLVRQMALSSVRIERAAQQETAALANRVRHASSEFDLNRLREIDRLFETIDTCPGDHRRRLLAQPEGVDKLIEALVSARDQLRNKASKLWGTEDHKRIEAMFGGTFGNFPITRTDALLSAMQGRYSYLSPGDAQAHPTAPQKREFARIELIGIIELELIKLAKIRAGLDPEALEQDRAEAADRALFDPDPVAILARKYEAAATRVFFRALRDFHQNEANSGEVSVSPEQPIDLEANLGDESADMRIIGDGSKASPCDEPNEATSNGDEANGIRTKTAETAVNATATALESDDARGENEPNLVRPATQPPAQPAWIPSPILHHHF